MFEHDQDAVVERYRATSGRFTGVLGLVVAGVVLFFDLRAWSAGTPLGLAIGALLAGVLIWATMLRPSVWVTARDVVLRGMFYTDHVPLAAIDRVAVTHVLTVTAGGRSFTSPAVGYSARKVVKGRAERIQQAHTERSAFAAPDSRPAAPPEASSPQAFVEARLAHLAQDARDRTGIRQGSPEQAALVAQARRTWAWPEIIATGLLTLAFVGWVLV